MNKSTNLEGLLFRPARSIIMVDILYVQEDETGNIEKR